VQWLFGLLDIPACYLIVSKRLQKFEVYLSTKTKYQVIVPYATQILESSSLHTPYPSAAVSVPVRHTSVVQYLYKGSSNTHGELSGG
jgi:hypothetical protein